MGLDIYERVSKERRGEGLTSPKVQRLIKRFQQDLYSKRTHFIFELLQNAEDAGASKILFVPHEDRLEVKHDGNAFTEDDVRRICDYSESSKTDDPTKIGRFGMGFKSIYAYTSVPKIYSGKYSFNIEQYVLPCKKTMVQIRGEYTTLFILPFDKAEISAEKALEEITGELKKLDAIGFLFLRNIREIGYELPDGEFGTYTLGKEKANGVTKATISQKHNEGCSRQWLIFEKGLREEEARECLPENEFKGYIKSYKLLKG